MFNDSFLVRTTLPNISATMYPSLRLKNSAETLAKIIFAPMPLSNNI